MDAEAAKKLRAPFKPEQIGKLPKPTKRENPKGKCPECGGWHGLPAVHLDYVGHAAVTDRLLEVDPEWTWAPMAHGPQGEPLMANGGLWINLTVCGVTRPGFGDDTSGKGTKEVIGDAIRNAAMRFGVALDLWSKEDLTGQGTAPTEEPPPAAEANGNGAFITTGKGSQQERMFTIAGKAKVSRERVKELVMEVAGVEHSAEIPRVKYDEIVERIKFDGVPFE